MRMYDLRIEILAENERHAERLLLRVMETLSSEQLVLSVGGLDDITNTATDADELTDDEVEGFLRERDIFFINRLRRLRSST